MTISHPATLNSAEAPSPPATSSANPGSPANPGSTRSSTSRKKEFFTPTLISIGIEIGSVAFLTALLLLLISLRPGDGGEHGGGSGNGTSGQGGTGEFAAAGSGSGMASDEDNSATGSSEQSQEVTEVSETPGTSGPQQPPSVSSAKSGTPLKPPDEKSNVFIVQDLPKAAAPAPAAQEPEGAGGGNGFSDLGDRLQKAGARTGDVQISLAWNNGNDLDLHVETPSDEKIWYNHRQSSCGGELDVDMNAGGPTSQRPVENVYWPAGGSPTGKFRVLVHHYANHGGRDPTRFQVTIKIKGRSQSFSGSLRHGDDLKLVREFSFP